MQQQRIIRKRIITADGGAEVISKLTVSNNLETVRTDYQQTVGTEVVNGYVHGYSHTTTKTCQ